MEYEFIYILPIVVIVGLSLVMGAFSVLSWFEEWAAKQIAKLRTRRTSSIARNRVQETQPREG